MSVPLTFDVGERHYASCLDLACDRAMLAALGRRCIGFIRQTVDIRFHSDDASRVFLGLLHPGRVPADRSFVFGIFDRSGGAAGRTPRLVGVIHFLHHATEPSTWYIPLFLLEPAARGQGLGTAAHAAFAQWAVARGAHRFWLAVKPDNERALHFWSERLGYTGVDAREGRTWREAGSRRWNREFQHRLVPAPAAVPWVRMWV